jgi:hypothetical protein
MADDSAIEEPSDQATEHAPAGGGLDLDTPLSAFDEGPQDEQTTPADEAGGAEDTLELSDDIVLPTARTRPSFDDGEEPPAPPPSGDETIEANEESRVEFKSFRSDDLVSVDLTDEAPDDEDQTIASAPAVETESPGHVPTQASDQVELADNGLFDGEYREGLAELAGGNWTSAVHHLSIAAALKPDHPEVREKLREARRGRQAAQD